jgi:type IV secretion system protein VirB1
MMLELATILKIATACAPNVAPETLGAVAGVESGYDPLAISVNDGKLSELHAVSWPQALGVARVLVNQQHRSVDLGLMQINAATLRDLGLPVEAAFDPCASLAAAGRVLEGGYLSAGGTSGAPPQLALRKALSMYNTGSPTRGFANGYVRRVEAAADQMQAVLAAPLRPVWRVPVTTVILPPLTPSDAPSISLSSTPGTRHVDYAAGTPVPVSATPTQPTEIVFAPDEQVSHLSISVATAWLFSPVGNILLVKPSAPGPLTEMNVVTARADGFQRSYLFLLDAQDSVASPLYQAEYARLEFAYPPPPVQVAAAQPPHPAPAHIATAQPTHPATTHIASVASHHPAPAHVTTTVAPHPVPLHVVQNVSHATHRTETHPAHGVTKNLRAQRDVPLHMALACLHGSSNGHGC